MNLFFLKLLQPFPFDDSFAVNDGELRGLESLSLRHALFPLVYAQLVRYREAVLLSNAMGEFLRKSKDLYLKGIAISARQENAEEEILSLLGGNGIQSVVIKGNAIAKEIYNDRNCRISSDIDILIRKADATAVHGILTTAGYMAEENMPLGYCLSRIHHASYHHPRNNILIEIHWAFGVPYFFSLHSEEIWNEMITADSGQVKLSPEMILVMLLIHHHSHAFRELKILVDVLWALYKYDKIINWNLFADKLKAIGLLKSTRIALHQIKSLWNEAAHEMKCIDALQQEIEVGSRVSKPLLSYFRMDLDDDASFNLYKDKLIARFALDRWTTIASSCFRTLFPVPEAIKELYNDRSNLALPLNYMKFIKWRLTDWIKG